jgi:hypothetical protein
MDRQAQARMGAQGRAKMVAEYDQDLVIAAYRLALKELCTA